MKTPCTPTNFCKCGCGTPIPLGNIWAKGHHRRGVKHSEKALQKMREARLGTTPWNKGIPRTESEKRAISQGITKEGRARNSERVREGWKNGAYDSLYGETNPACRPEVREKIGQNWLGRHHTEETKEKLREARLGQPGTPVSEERKQEYSERMRANNPMYRKDVLQKHPVLKSGPKYRSVGENKLAEILMGMGVVFQRQRPLRKPVGFYVVDFYLRKHRGIIEFDGHHSHVEYADKDKERDAYLLATYGYPTLRILSPELNNSNREALIERIGGFIHECQARKS